LHLDGGSFRTCPRHLLDNISTMNSSLTIQSHYWAVRDYLSPVLRESKFKEHGRITPEEFVAAGDFLAYKFPVWSWQAGDASQAKNFLPADKQYLLTRGVPCLRRASSLAYTDAEEDAERLVSAESGPAGDDWVQTHAGRTSERADAHVIDEIPDLDGGHDVEASLAAAAAGMSLTGGNVAGNPLVGDIPDIDDIPDMEEADLEEAEDAAAAPPPVPAQAGSDTRGNLLQVRTYDVMITYDKYYQTPRLWLLGYDEKGTVLTPAQVFQDVPSDHAFKTVTIESFPHSATLSCASVHPCKHASVMKKIIERMNSHVEEQKQAAGKSTKDPKDKESKKRWLSRKVTGGSDTPKAAPPEDDDNDGMRVDFYLVVFLKFIASIVPTIEVDSTTAF